MTLNILLVAADAGGNVPPVLAVADELRDRGHRVTCAGLRPTGGDVEHVPLPAITGRDPGPAASVAAQTSGMFRMGVSPALGRQVRDLIAVRKPDAVLVDGIMITSIRAAERTGVPTGVLFHSFGALWGGPMSHGPVHALLHPFGLSPMDVWRTAEAKLLLTDRELDPLTDAENDIGFEWTGTTERGIPRDPGASIDPPLVLVSLSSVVQKNQDEVYGRVIAALGDLPVRVVVTRPMPDTPYRGAVPSNTELRGRTPHSEILPHASLVVGHGGHSTTMRALAHGVPLLILPMNTASDQPLIGEAVQRNGLGRSLPRTASVPAIADAARRILGDRSIAAATTLTGERLRGQRGAARAADRVEKIARA